MRIVALALTVIVMAVLQRAARAGPVEARATVALGFLLIAGYWGGTLAARAGLPRITGFLLTGFIVGPSWLGLVRPDEVAALDTIATAALALIALGAGAELRFAALWPQRVRLLRSSVAAMAAPFLAVTLVVLTVSPWFPLTVHQPFRDAVVVALVLGIMLALSSPVLTHAVLTDDEPGRGGGFATTVRHVAIVQDIAAALLIALLLLVAQPLASAGAVSPGSAGVALRRLGGALLAGALLGGALAFYLEVIRAHLVLVLIAVAFVITQSVRFVGLEAVLMALAAGVTLENVAPAHSARLRPALQRCALPIHIVFFAAAGCGLRLSALNELWPWALLLIGLRLSALRAGMRWAARHPAVSAQLGRYGWLGLVSQDGLGVTLAVVLRRAFPEWGVSLESLLLAMIGVHQVAGPICLHWALRRVGDWREEGHARDNADTGAGSVALATGAGRM